MVKKNTTTKTDGKRPKKWIAPPEPKCLECWGLRHMYKRNAPKCIVCRGAVPARTMSARTAFGTDSAKSTAGQRAAKTAKARAAAAGK